MDYYDYENGYSKKKERTMPIGLAIALIPIVFLLVVFIVVIFCIITLKFYPDGVIAYYIIDIIETIQAKFQNG